MTDNEFKEFYQKALDHLLNGRYKLGLNDAEKLIEERPNDGKASVIYGWALLENGDPAKALEFANLAVELAPDSFTTRMYRGIILGKMSIFDGASYVPFYILFHFWGKLVKAVILSYSHLRSIGYD